MRRPPGVGASPRGGAVGVAAVSPMSDASLDAPCSQGGEVSSTDECARDDGGVSTLRLVRGRKNPPSSELPHRADAFVVPQSGAVAPSAASSVAGRSDAATQGTAPSSSASRGSSVAPFVEDVAGAGSMSVALVATGAFECRGVNEKRSLGRFLCRRRLGRSVHVGRRLQSFYAGLARAVLLVVRLVVGGYPCQGHSTANARRRLDDDPRSALAPFALWLLLRTLRLSVFRGGELAVHIGENIDNKEVESPETVAAERRLAIEEGYVRHVVRINAFDYGASTFRLRTLAVTEVGCVVEWGGRPRAPPATGPGPPLSSLLEPLASRPRWSWFDPSASTICFERTAPEAIALRGPRRAGFLRCGDVSYAVWCTDGPAWVVKAWGPPPCYSGGHFYFDEKLGVILVLTALECSRVNGLADDLYWEARRWMQNRGWDERLIDEELRETAGNGDDGTARAVAALARTRIALFDEFVRTKRVRSWRQFAPRSLPPSTPPPTPPGGWSDDDDKGSDEDEEMAPAPARESAAPPVQPPVARVPSRGARLRSVVARTAAVLAVVALSGPNALVASPRGAASLFLGESISEARGATVARAPSFMPTELAAAVGSAAPFLVGEADSLLWSDETRGRLVALPLAEAPATDVDWLPLSAFADGPFYSLAAAAISRVASFRAGVSAPDDVSVLGVAAGARAASLLRAPKPLAVPNARAWKLRLAGAARAEAKLRSVLAAAGGALLEWAGQVGRVDASDVPECLRGEEEPSPSLVDIPFSEVFVAEPTERMKLHPQTPRPSDDFCPRQLEDIYDAEAVAAIRDWVANEAAQMRTYSELGAEAERQFNVCLAIDQSHVHAPARGVVWDARTRDSRGCWRPLDTATPLPSHLHLDVIEADFADYPDSELLGFVLDGAQFKAELPLDLVLCPHLTTLPWGFDKVEKDLKRKAELGWYEAFSDFPFLPIRLQPRGCVARKLEKDRPREVCDCGAPRREVFTMSGRRRVESLNDAVGIRLIDACCLCPIGHPADDPLDLDLALALDPRLPENPSWDRVFDYRWLKEIKPLVVHKMKDDAILREGGVECGDDVVTGTDDFADFFNQIRLAPGEMWKVGLLWTPFDESHDPASFLAEYVLNFGNAASSNTAQRFAWALIWRLELEVERLERPLLDAVTEPQCRAWLDRRLELERQTGRPQQRLFAAKVYTDDVVITAVGAERMARILECWTGMMQRYGIRMAIAEKRQIGASVLWLGLSFHSTIGVLSVPKDKHLRCLGALDCAIRGELTFDLYRSLVGLLQHLRPVAGLSRAAMYGLYEPFAGGFEIGPAMPVRLSQLAIGQLERWRERLGCSSGVSFVSAFGQSRDGAEWFASQSRAVFYAYSDAAKEGAAVPSIGGFLHGAWWTYPLEAADLELPIAVLELVGVVVNFVMFAGAVPRPAVLALVTDSLTSADAMRGETARSRAMQAVHHWLVQSPLFADLDGRVLVVHGYGDGNPAADMASRGKFDELRQLCRQLRLHAQRLEAPVALARLLLGLAATAARAGLPVAAACSEVSQLRAPRRLRASLSSRALVVDICGLAHCSRHSTSLEHGEKSMVGRTCDNDAPTGTPSSLLQSVFDNCDAAMRGAARPQLAVPAILSTHRSRIRHEPAAILGGAQAALLEFNAPRVAAPQREPAVVAVNAQSRVAPGFALLEFNAPRVAAPQRQPAVVAVSAQSRAAPGFALLTHRAPTRAAPVAAAAPAVAIPSDAPERSPKRPRPPPSRTVMLSPPPLPHAAAAAESLYTSLANDDSDMALRPDDPTEMRASCGALVEACADGRGWRTNRQDAQRWKKWELHCAKYRTPAIRRNTAANTGADVDGFARESFLICRFLIDIYASMEARSHADPAPKPESAMAYVYAVRRMHQNLGIVVASAPQLRLLLKHMYRSYVRQFGPESLIPKRRDPFPTHGLVRILQLPNGTRVGGRTIDWATPFWLSFRLMLLFAFWGGFRKEELTVPRAGAWDRTCASRASTCWMLDGARTVEDAAAALPAGRNGVLRRGDIAVFRPGCSKADEFGLEWGAKPVYFPNVPTILSLPRVLADVEAKVPVAPEDREHTPLFVDDRGEAISASVADSVLYQLMVIVFGEAVAKTLSWHAFRVRLACALLATEHGRPLIQALVRWKSDEALDIYARIEPADACRALEKAALAELHSSASRNLPFAIDADDLIAHVRALADAG